MKYLNLTLERQIHLSIIILVFVIANAYLIDFVSFTNYTTNVVQLNKDINMASSLIQIRVDENVKNIATEIFNSLGLSISEAVRLFLKRSVIEQGLPFRMNLENTSTENNDNLSTNVTSNSMDNNDFDALSYIYSSGEEDK